MGIDKRQEAYIKLLEQADKQGYITFDNIMDCADDFRSEERRVGKECL